jgi:hypothetical protein
MNRAERRRRQSLEKGFKEFHRLTREGGFGPTGGAMEAIIARGPLMVTKYFTVMAQFSAQIVRGGEKPPLCLACDYEFRASKTPPVALAITSPVHVAPSPAIVTGICEVCAQFSDEELLDHVYRGLKKLGLAERKLGQTCTGREQ